MWPLIYIAGPYKGKTHDYKSYVAIGHNILRAQSAAIWCASNGICYFCPHLHSAHNEVIMPEVKAKFWYNLDLRIASQCDVLLLVDGWEQSNGSLVEKDYFRSQGKPIFQFDFVGRTALLEWYNLSCEQSRLGAHEREEKWQ